MDYIPENPILKFHSDTLLTLRRNYKLEKNEEINVAIDLLNDWLNKQAHLLKKDYSREYLERAIIFQKGSIERTKTQIDKMCTLRTLLPKFFDNYDPQKDYLEVIQYSYMQAVLPTLTSDNRRIYLGKIGDISSSKLIFTIYTWIIMWFEYLRLHDYCDGYILIFDLTETNILDLVKIININEMHQMIVIALDGYALRVKGIHLVTPSSAVDMLVKLLRQILSKKMGSRIHVHKHIDSIHKVVDKTLLPKEYGGSQDSLKSLYDALSHIISSDLHTEYVRNINTARTEESLRQKNNLIKNEYLGITGSFRMLCVD